MDQKEIIGYHYFNEDGTLKRCDYDRNMIISGKYPNHAFSYANYNYITDKSNNIIIEKDIESIIALSPYYSFRYAIVVIRGKASDIIEKSIAQSSELSLRYASQTDQPHSDIIISAIAQEPDFAWEYARDVIVGRVPEELERSLAKNPHHAFFYATNFIGKPPIPDFLLKSIKSNRDYTRMWATYLHIPTDEENW